MTVAPPVPPSRPASPPLLQVRDLSVGFETDRGELSALDAVTIDVFAGDVVGIVGESGSGKTVLAKAVLGLLPERGVSLHGQILLGDLDLLPLTERELQSVRGDRIGLIFQDPMTSLSPIVRVGRQITESIRIHQKVTRRAAASQAVDLLKALGFADPEKRMRWYPHQLSGGMRQRVMIASSLICEPEILIADEATTGLDPIVELQLMGLLSSQQAARSFTLVIISHDLKLVGQFASTIVVLYAGRVMEMGPARAIMERPRVPYTAGLLAAAPDLNGGGRAVLQPIEGGPPDLVHPPAGCRFAPRCGSAGSRCLVEAPPLREADADGHRFACWHPVGG